MAFHITYKIVPPVIHVVKMETVEDLEILIDEFKANKLKLTEVKLNTLRVHKMTNTEIPTIFHIETIPNYGTNATPIVGLGDYVLWNQNKIPYFVTNVEEFNSSMIPNILTENIAVPV